MLWWVSQTESQSKLENLIIGDLGSDKTTVLLSLMKN